MPVPEDTGIKCVWRSCLECGQPILVLLPDKGEPKIPASCEEHTHA